MVVPPPSLANDISTGIPRCCRLMRWALACLPKGRLSSIVGVHLFKVQDCEAKGRMGEG